MPVCYAWLAFLKHSEPLPLGGMSTRLPDPVCVAYARATVGAVRLAGHGVNVRLLDPAMSDFLLTQAENCSVSAMRIARHMADLGLVAPASFHELELVSGLADVIVGSDTYLVADDAAALLSLIEDSMDEIGMVEDAA